MQVNFFGGTFLIKHRLINKSQNEFLKATPCLTNLLCSLDSITKWIDKSSPVGIVYLDFQKTFDKVAHRRLFMKLWRYDSGDKMENWVENCLEDRKQKVLADGSVSD